MVHALLSLFFQHSAPDISGGYQPPARAAFVANPFQPHFLGLFDFLPPPELFFGLDGRDETYASDFSAHARSSPGAFSSTFGTTTYSRITLPGIGSNCLAPFNRRKSARSSSESRRTMPAPCNPANMFPLTKTQEYPNIFLGSAPGKPEVAASKAATDSGGAGFHFFMTFSPIEIFDQRFKVVSLKLTISNPSNTTSVTRIPPQVPHG